MRSKGAERGLPSDPSPWTNGDIKLVTVAWAEGIQAAIHAFKEITSPYWLNEKRLKDHRLKLIGNKLTEATETIT